MKGTEDTAPSLSQILDPPMTIPRNGDPVSAELWQKYPMLVINQI